MRQELLQWFLTSQFEQRQVLGISFREESLCLTGVQQRRRGVDSAEAQRVALDPELLEKNQESYLVEQIQKSLGAFKHRYHETYIDISSQQVITQQLTLSAGASKDLFALVKKELSPHVGEAFEASYHWSFIKLRQLKSDEYTVLTMLVPRSELDPLLSAVQKSGLRPMGVHYAPISFWNSLTPYFAKQSSKEEKHHLLIYAENQTLHIMMVTPLELVTYRKISVDMPALHRSIETEGVSSEGVKAQLSKITQEIQTSLDYALEHLGIQSVRNIFLSGDEKGLEQILPALNLNFEQEILLYDPFEHIPLRKDLDKSLAKPRSHFSGAVGCILQAPPSVNLLPEIFRSDIQRRKHRVLYQKTAVWGSVFGCAIFGFFIIYRVVLGYQMQTYLNTITILQNSLEGIRLIEKKKVILEQEGEAFKKVAGVQLPFHQILLEISQVIPDQMVLESLQYSETTELFELKGASYYGPGEAESQLAAFIQKIEASRHFEKVRLAYFTQKNPKSGKATFMIQTRFLEVHREVAYER